MSSAAKSVLSVEKHDQAIVAAVVCRNLDHESTAQLQRELETALAAAPALSLVLDLSAVEFAPSLALGLLVKTHKELTQAGRKCVLVGIQPLLQEVMKITALAKYLQICATTADGLKQI
jgi:anti-anti-sigma factor